MCPDRPEAWGASFRLGDGVLHLRSGFSAFTERFEALFGDCSLRSPSPELPSVECAIGPGADGALASADFALATVPDLVGFVRQAFPDREARAVDSPSPWNGLSIGSGSSESLYRWQGARIEALSDHGWQSFFGSLAVAHTMRLQDGMAFIHAGSLAIDGKGVIVCGPKGSGKTTLTLGLGAADHAVLGDEVAAIRTATRELVAFRRAASIRPGPRSAALAPLLEGTAWTQERYADGRLRVRVPISRLFPHASSLAVAPLRAVFLLQGFEDRASIEEVRMGPGVLEHLNLLGASLSRLPAITRVFKLLSCLSGIPCFAIRCGGVEETCRLIEGAIAT